MWRWSRDDVPVRPLRGQGGCTMRMKFCPHCGKAHPANACCPCRRRKRRPTPGDATRRKREPWRKEYSGPEYQAARQEVIERQKGRCKDCGTVCARKVDGRWHTKGCGGEVDHEVPLRQGGTSEASSMALRCKRCHARADARRRRHE